MQTRRPAEYFADERCVIVALNTACRLDDEALAALLDTLDRLAHPAPGAGRPSHHSGKDPR